MCACMGEHAAIPPSVKAVLTTALPWAAPLAFPKEGPSPALAPAPQPPPHLCMAHARRHTQPHQPLRAQAAFAAAGAARALGCQALAFACWAGVYEGEPGTGSYPAGARDLARAVAEEAGYGGRVCSHARALRSTAAAVWMAGGWTGVRLGPAATQHQRVVLPQPWQMKRGMGGKQAASTVTPLP